MKTLILSLLFSLQVFSASPVIWQSAQYAKFLNSLGFKMNDNKIIRTLTVDPSAGAGIAAPVGSLGFRDNSNVGEIWSKTGTGDTDWKIVRVGLVSLTTEVTGVLPVANGGTAKNLTLANGGLIYSDADSFEVSAVGTSGQALISGGAGAPTWFAPTAGSVLFAGASGILAQDNASLFYDDTNDELGIGTSPVAPLHVHRAGSTLNEFKMTNGTTGAGASDGFTIYVTTAGQAQLRNFEAQSMLFYTANSKRFQIDGSGNVAVQNQAATQLATNATDGFLYIPSSAGTPSGTPTVVTSTVPIEVDTTNSRFYFYNSGWLSPVMPSSTDTLTNKTIDADGTGNSISNIENADIKAAAAIAVNKLAAVTADRALISDGSGFVAVSATSATELGYVDGVTSAIQTQIDGKISNPMDSTGDLIYGGASGAPTKLDHGTQDYVLQANGANAPTWVNPHAGKGFFKVTNASDFTTTSASFVTANDASYNTYTNGGLAIAPGTANDLGFRVASLPAGTYKIHFSGNMLVQYSGSTTQCTYLITDGSNLGTLHRVDAISTGQSSISTMSALFTYGSTQTNIDFKAQTRRDAGSGTCYFSNGSQGMFFTIERII